MKNQRRDFLKAACTPVALAILGIPLTSACSGDTDEVDLFNEGLLEIDLSQNQFQDLKAVNGWVNYQAKKLLLFRVSNNEILAFNNACPHQGNRNGWSLQGNQFVCSFHGRKYDANCNSALRCFNTSLLGDILTISR